MAIPFLKDDTEESATQKWAFIAIVLITIGLMVMNVSGALASSVGESRLAITIRTSLAVLLAGAEMLAAVALVRVMLAPNLLRKIAGGIIFVGLAWACIQNGKRAVHLVYPEFAESASLLEAKAGIAGDEAGLVADARQKAIDATPVELERTRDRIAALKAEQALMASQSPEKIKEAQSLLIAQGKYYGRVDGIRAELTEAAMRARGEEIAGTLAELELKEQSLAAGVIAVTAVAAANPAIQQAELADKARTAKAAGFWLEVMLWVLEGARSFGLWAYVTTVTAKSGRRKEDKEAAQAAVDDEATNAPQEQERPEPDDGTPGPQAAPEEAVESETEAEAETEAAPVEDTAEPAANDDPPPKPKNPGSAKGGESTAFNHETGQIDDSIPVDPPGMERAA